MHKRSVLDSRLYVRLGVDNASVANERFANNAENLAHFGSQLLLYDQVKVPTKDFGVVPALCTWCGANTISTLLEEGVVSFVRVPSLLGYVGNGGGINAYVLRPGAKPMKWWQEATFGELGSALEIQVEHSLKHLDSGQRRKLIDLVLKRTEEVEWTNEDFMSAVVRETNLDIQKNAAYSDFVRKHEPEGSGAIDMRRLTGIAANQVRVSSLKPMRDAIDLVLRIAEINLDILMAYTLGDSDVVSPSGVTNILTSKLERAGLAPTLEGKFLGLIDLTNIPDIRLSLRTGSISPVELISLRQSRAGKNFRRWLRDANPSDARDLERLYVETLGKTTKYQTLPVRILRFVTITAIGIVEPLTGLVGGATDSFLIEKWLGGYSPRLFLDELRELPTKSADRTK